MRRVCAEKGAASIHACGWTAVVTASICLREKCSVRADLKARFPERQPGCDGSGVGFGVAGAEKPTALWSHHSILRSDETWLPEWSGNLGGVKQCAVRSRGCPGARQSFGLRRQASWLKVWRGGGWDFRATERAQKRNGGQVVAEWRLPSLVTNSGVQRNGICGIQKPMAKAT